MKKLIIFSFLLSVCWLAGATESFGQCRGTDTPIAKTLKRAKNQNPAILKGTIRLCTSHVYRFLGKAGQNFAVKLTTGKKTGLTVLTPSGERLVDGDALRWSGELAEDGQYEIQIGTDAAAARYTLEVSIELPKVQRPK